MVKGLAVQQEVSLKDHSTFRIGGKARYFVPVKTTDEMKEALAFARQHSLKAFLLGKGSNCLFDDRGFNGLVILNRIDTLQEDDHGTFTVGSGFSFSRLGFMTAKLGWSGLEFAAGIPGTVGGAIYMNAGAHNQDTASALESVKYMNEDLVCTDVAAHALSFSYRKSPFQHMRGIILSATFKLKVCPTAQETVRELISSRRATQPLEAASAGCYFRNPPGDSAGRLIEAAAMKGVSVGGASVSTKHANFIINAQDATSSDVLALAALVRQRVNDLSGLDLQSEVRFIPYE